MATVNIYLTFNGNCEEAFKFYQSVFGGEFPYIGRFKDMPAGEGPKLKPVKRTGSCMSHYRSAKKQY
jgi:PhnB protein